MSLWDRIQKDNAMIRRAEEKDLIELKSPDFIKFENRDDWKDEKGNFNGPAFIDVDRWTIHVASVAYYHFGFGTMQDETFDWMCKHLVDNQRKYPDYKGYMHEYFSDDWSGGTAYDIPITAMALDYVEQSARIRQIVIDTDKLDQLRRDAVEVSLPKLG